VTVPLPCHSSEDFLRDHQNGNFPKNSRYQEGLQTVKKKNIFPPARAS